MGDGFDPVREQVGQAGIPALDEIGAEPDLGLRFDLLLHGDHAAAGKMLAAIFEARRKTRSGQPFGQASIGEVLGVDQNTVAIEDNQLGCVHQAVPVEPNPPEPRAVPPANERSSTVAWVTDAKTICAIRMPRVTAKSSSPRLTSRTPADI